MSGNARRSPVGAGMTRQASVSGPRGMQSTRRLPNLFIANPDSEDEDEDDTTAAAASRLQEERRKMTSAPAAASASASASVTLSSGVGIPPPPPFGTVGEPAALKQKPLNIITQPPTPGSATDPTIGLQNHKPPSGLAAHSPLSSTATTDSSGGNNSGGSGSIGASPLYQTLPPAVAGGGPAHISAASGQDVTAFRPLPIIGSPKPSSSSSASRTNLAAKKSMDRVLPKISTPPSIPLPLPPPHSSYSTPNQYTSGPHSALSSPAGTGSPASPSRETGPRRSSNTHPVPTLPPRPAKHPHSNISIGSGGGGGGHGPLPAVPTTSTNSTGSHPLPMLPPVAPPPGAQAYTTPASSGPKLGNVRLQVTMDNENFSVVDVSGSATSEAVLERVFARLRYRDEDFGSLSIFRTDIGEQADEEPVPRSQVHAICYQEGDSKGGLKFLVKQTGVLPSPSSAVVPPPVLGVNMLTNTGFIYGTSHQQQRAVSASSQSGDHPRHAYQPRRGEGSVSSASENKASPSSYHVGLPYDQPEGDVHPFAMNATLSRHQHLISHSGRRVASSGTSRGSRSPIEDRKPADHRGYQFASPPPSLDSVGMSAPSSSISTSAAGLARRGGDATPTMPLGFKQTTSGRNNTDSRSAMESSPELYDSPERVAGPSDYMKHISDDTTAADLELINRFKLEDEEARRKAKQLEDDARVAQLEQDKERAAAEKQKQEEEARSRERLDLERLERERRENDHSGSLSRRELADKALREREKLVGRERRERRMQWENRQQIARAQVDAGSLGSVIDNWRNIVSYDDASSNLAGTSGTSGNYYQSERAASPLPQRTIAHHSASVPVLPEVDVSRQHSYDRAHASAPRIDTLRSTGSSLSSNHAPHMAGLGLVTEEIYRDDAYRSSPMPQGQSAPAIEGLPGDHSAGVLAFPEPKPYSPILASDERRPSDGLPPPAFGIAEDQSLSHLQPTGMRSSMLSTSSNASIATVLPSAQSPRRVDEEDTEDDSGNTARADNWQKTLSTMMGDASTVGPSDESTLQGPADEETLWFTPPVPLASDNNGEGTVVPGSSSLLNLATRPRKLSVNVDVGDTPVGQSQPSSAEASDPPTSTSDAEGTTSGSRVTRSKSFARHKDQWNFRPPAEDVYENLQEFFPKIDLDKPVLDPKSLETESIDPTSPRTDSPEPQIEPQRKEEPSTAAAAAVTKGRGGFNRAEMRKSIRVVAEGRKRHLSKIAPAAAHEEKTSLARKRSSSMWGHKVVEVTPSGIKNGTIPEAVAETKADDGKPITMTWVKGDLIGKGTYGRVYLALNATTGDMIAVKQVEKPRTESDRADARQAGMIEALKSEIALLKNLEHPNVVTYLGWEESHKYLSIFLEYVPGGSIASVYRKHKKFEEPVIKSFTRQILDGLAYLHSQNILHRDLKADNILVDPAGICKISDFGISKRTDGEGAYDSMISTNLKGSVFWMAPEVVHSIKGQGYSAKVDIWSLGCVVLEMWAGRRPWGDMEALAAMFQLANTRAAPPVPDDVNLSPVADDFLNKRCFAPNPRDRPTATDLLRHPFILDVDPMWTFAESAIGKAVAGSMKR